jgi:uncharacterized protein
VALVTPATFLTREPREYRGSELRSHWIYETFGVQGDAICAFAGRVDVRGARMVDLADVQAGLVIAGDSMLHFILESFGPDLDRAVFMQRLLVVLACEKLAARGALGLRRSGDDIYLGRGKLSVSIATVSPVSCLVHFGINVTQDGTPVETAALRDAGIDPFDFAQDMLAGYAHEITQMARATTKVRSVS